MRASRYTIRESTATATTIDKNMNNQLDRQLLDACRDNHPQRAKRHLGNGADAEATDRYGNTPLILATESGYDDCIDVLIEHGANIKAANENGVTALMRATEAAHDHNIKKLLAHGADVNATTTNKETALMRALWCSSIKCVKLLLENGADVDAIDSHGENVLLQAAWSDNHNCLKLLIEYGADSEPLRDKYPKQYRQCRIIQEKLLLDKTRKETRLKERGSISL